MISIWTVIGLGFVTLIFTLFLKNTRPELALLVQLCGMVSILLLLLGGFGVIKEKINDIFPIENISSDILNNCFKAVGICLITSFSSNLCKDFGQTALSANIETAGKIIVVILSLPMVKSITQTALELIG